MGAEDPEHAPVRGTVAEVICLGTVTKVIVSGPHEEAALLMPPAKLNGLAVGDRIGLESPEEDFAVRERRKALGDV